MCQPRWSRPSRPQWIVRIGKLFSRTYPSERLAVGRHCLGTRWAGLQRAEEDPRTLQAEAVFCHKLPGEWYIYIVCTRLTFHFWCKSPGHLLISRIFLLISLQSCHFYSTTGQNREPLTIRRTIQFSRHSTPFEMQDVSLEGNKRGELLIPGACIANEIISSTLHSI